MTKTKGDLVPSDTSVAHSFVKFPTLKSVFPFSQRQNVSVSLDSQCRAWSMTMAPILSQWHYTQVYYHKHLLCRHLSRLKISSKDGHGDPDPPMSSNKPLTILALKSPSFSLGRQHIHVPLGPLVARCSCLLPMHPPSQRLMVNTICIGDAVRNYLLLFVMSCSFFRFQK